ncbi:hypothetical protein [Massilia sp.]|uniref:hypothetical protein n=1 Tax=Massilia sp. TaxID=1882437 RepID=UPI002897F445|nr:hypothetical protein [Massilia sp.]
MSFRFEHELAAIFGAYGDAGGRANMLLLDADERVISSADPLWIAPGAKVPVSRGAGDQTCMFAGREYLVATIASYAGLPGLPFLQTYAKLDVAYHS